ncbi:MAG: hypothetical protein JETT_2802 [Candidatus Jettenia ecosi]|uniref:Uncharacterized protein n=1 Tax=Candidatus Jettenia ecosi TaxID=2494326 RepID=A0A533Q8K8_9BACT|nr:MAG: hypothetical protein JETT_2802 [Candidatus Jettenia ecosi]
MSKKVIFSQPLRASQSPKQGKEEVIPLDPPLEKGETCECFEKEGLGKPCQRENTGIVNSLSSTKEIPTFPPFLNHLHISPFFKGGSRGIKMLQSLLLRNDTMLPITLFGQPLSPPL